MLMIRLARKGRRNKATFRVVLQEKTKAPSSSALEILGSYNPHVAKREEQINLQADRITYWLSQGAQPSNTVHNMLVEFGIIEGTKKRSVQPKLKPQAEGSEAPAATEAKKEEAPAEKPAEKQTIDMEN